MADNTLSPATLTAGVAVVGLVTGFGGSLIGLYARGRSAGAADAKRDQQIADHERRLDTHGNAISQIRAEGHETAKAVAGLAAEVKAVGRTVDAIYAMLHGGGGGGRK